jgi:hypothetical protein
MVQFREIAKILKKKHIFVHKAMILATVDYFRRVLLSDSKSLWINMATMYENLYGNCVGGVEMSEFFYFIAR